MQPVACNMQMFPRFVCVCLRWIDTSFVIAPPPSGSLKTSTYSPCIFYLLWNSQADDSSHWENHATRVQRREWYAMVYEALSRLVVAAFQYHKIVSE